MPILQEVEVNLALSGGNGARGGGNVAMLAFDHARKQVSEGAGLVVGELPRQRNENVKPGSSARLDERGKPNAIAELLRRFGQFDDMRKRSRLGIEVQQTPIGMLDIRDAAHP